MNKGSQFKREWVFNPDLLVLWYFDAEGRQMTEIDLERIKKPISMLDWMVHLMEKTWAHEDPRTIMSLLQGFAYAFGSIEGIENCTAAAWASKLKGIKKKTWRFFPEPAFDTEGPDEDPNSIKTISASVLMKLALEHEEVWIQVSRERCIKAGMTK